MSLLSVMHMFRSRFKPVKPRKFNELKHIVVIAVGSILSGVKMMVDVVTLYFKYYCNQLAT